MLACIRTKRCAVFDYVPLRVVGGCKPSHHQDMWDVALGEEMFVEGHMFDSNVGRKLTGPVTHACGTACSAF